MASLSAGSPAEGSTSDSVVLPQGLDHRLTYERGCRKGRDALAQRDAAFHFACKNRHLFDCGHRDLSDAPRDARDVFISPDDLVNGPLPMSCLLLGGYLAIKRAIYQIQNSSVP